MCVIAQRDEYILLCGVYGLNFVGALRVMEERQRVPYACELHAH